MKTQFTLIAALFTIGFGATVLDLNHGMTKMAEQKCFGPAMPQNELCQNVKAPHLN